MPRYRKGEDDEGRIPEGIAVPWSDGVVFKCPCGERDVYVASPPHEITWGEGGTLTLKGSVGSREDKGRSRAPNWCHFFIKGGDVEMCDDAQCPGGKG